MIIQKWSVEDFKLYVRKRIDKCYHDSASMIVLRSFHIADVQKPEGVTLRMFDFLRGVAEYEIKVYKAELAKLKQNG